MHTFDTLPEPLRQWLSKAVLPWSPVSARKIWNKLLSKGLSHEEALRFLAKAEEGTLAKEKHATGLNNTSIN